MPVARHATGTGPGHHHSAAVRAQAAAARLAEDGLALVGAPLSGEWGRQAAHILPTGAGHFDAVFCRSHQIARGVADALRAARARRRPAPGGRRAAGSRPPHP